MKEEQLFLPKCPKYDRSRALGHKEKSPQSTIRYRHFSETDRDAQNLRLQFASSCLHVRLPPPKEQESEASIKIQCKEL